MYTDSLITTHDPIEGIQRYQSELRKAGYDAPTSGPGSIRPKIEDGHGWLLDAGTWVIRWNEVDEETGETTIHQEHALLRFPEMGDKSDDEIWNRMAETCKEGHFKYTSNPRTTHQMEAYQRRVEPGTKLQREVVVDVNKVDETIRNIGRSQMNLQIANTIIAHEAKLPTNQSSIGCIKLMQQYGLSREEIAKLSYLPVKTIDNIHSSQIKGHKHLPALQQALTKYEQSLTGELQPTGTENANPTKVDIHADYEFGSPEWHAQKELSNKLLDNEDRKHLKFTDEL
jgi:hypothetical protein